MVTNKKYKKEIAKIVLIGYRCVGKTLIGKKLSEMTGWKYISTDQLIVEKCNRSITKIVEKEGWEKFRQIEYEVIRDLGKLYAAVIDCGGGVVENAKNMEILKTNALVVWVDASIEIIHLRLSGKTDRPPLVTNDLMNDIKTTYLRRRPLYQKYGDYIVDNSKGEAENLSKKIIKHLF